MKKVIINTCVVLLLAGLFLLSSCKKNNHADKGSFTWTHAGKSYEATAFAAFTGPNYSITPFHVLAGYGSFSGRFEMRIGFHLGSFAVGTYNIVPYPATVKTFDYVDDAGFNLAGTSGIVNITSNLNNRLSGNFSVTLIDGASVTSLITGSFINVTVEP